MKKYSLNNLYSGKLHASSQRLLYPVLSCLLVVFVFSFPAPVFGIGNQFTIGATVTSDVTPPSVPTGLSASGVSSSQIDISWTASTDNVAIGGYVLRRGGSVLATTTSTSYSDTGLPASTGYVYSIEAFDTSINYSGQSANVSATTSASSGGGGGGGGGDTTPPTVSSFSPVNNATGVSLNPTLTITMSELINKLSGNILVRRSSDNTIVDTIAIAGSSVVIVGNSVQITLSAPLLSNTTYYVEVPSGSFADQSSNPFAGFSGVSTWSFSTLDSVAPVISNVVSSTTLSTAGIAFDTNEGAQSVLSWGTTTDYNEGSASELTYPLQHYFSISGLSSATTYQFKIESTDSSGNSSTYTGVFTTQSPPPPPDTTPPANVTLFSAIPSYTSIALSWVLPTDPDLQSVKLMRKSGGYPVDQDDGTQVYLGLATGVTDTGRATSTIYYYAIFARDTSGNYSSGAIVSATTLDDTPPPPPPPTPTPTPSPTPTPTGDPGGGGGITPTSTPATTTPADVPVGQIATSTGPFGQFPATGTPSKGISNLPISAFIFSQPEERDQLVEAPGGIISVDGDKTLMVSIDARLLPDVLKTITISVAETADAKTVSSYLLKINKEKTAYQVSIGALRREGNFAFDIAIMDHDNQGVRHFPGVLQVYRIKRESVLPPNIQEAVDQTIENIKQPVAAVTPYAAPVGVAVGVSQAALVATNVTSFYDLYLLFLKLLGLLTGIFRKKKKEPWGVVYDSVTKRPLDPAYVIAQLRNEKLSKGEAITDLDGRYGFILNPGEYTIVANKTHYRFPSESLKGKARDEFYENLYFGDPFSVRDGSVVQYNIPLDPLEFDWNEFAKNQDKVFKVYSQKAMIKQIVFSTIFFAGFVLSAITLAINPSTINGVVVFVYTSILIFQIFWKATHKITHVRDRVTGKPIPFALIKIWLAGVNTVVKKVVADETGKFYVLVPPGKYYVTVEQKLADGSYREVLRSAEVELKGGVLKEDLLI